MRLSCRLQCAARKEPADLQVAKAALPPAQHAADYTHNTHARQTHETSTSDKHDECNHLQAFNMGLEEFVMLCKLFKDLVYKVCGGGEITSDQITSVSRSVQGVCVVGLKVGGGGERSHHI